MTTELTKAAQQALDEIHAGKRHPQLAQTERWIVAAVDAAMVEMKNISPPLRRSECERLIRAAAEYMPAPQQTTPATPEDMKVYDGIAAGYFADTQQATPWWSYAQMRVVDENTVDIGRVVAFADEQATPAPVGEPLFWYRPRSDGGYEGPLHDSSIEDVRKRSGAWMPLYTRPAPGVPDGFTLDQIADACVQAEISDSKFESLSIALAAAQAKGAGHA